MMVAVVVVVVVFVFMIINDNYTGGVVDIGFDDDGGLRIDDIGLFQMMMMMTIIIL